MDLKMAMEICTGLHEQLEQNMRSMRAAQRRPELAQRLQVPDASVLGPVIVELRRQAQDPQGTSLDPAQLKQLQNSAQSLQGEYRSQHQIMRRLQQDFESDHHGEQRRQMQMGRFDMHMHGRSRPTESSRAAEHLDQLAGRIAPQAAHAANLAYAIHKLDGPALSQMESAPVLEPDQLDVSPSTQLGQ